MDAFEIKAKMYEIINTKMAKLPITAENVGQVIADSLTLNYMEFRKTNSFYSVCGDKDREDEFIKGMESIVAGELYYLANYLSFKLRELFSADYGGLSYEYAIVDYHNLDSEEVKIHECEFSDEKTERYIEAVSIIINSKSKGRFVVSGIDVSILEAGTFARVNIAGIGFLLMREDLDEDGFLGSNIFPIKQRGGRL